MTENPYHVLGTTVSKLYGRAEVLKKMLRRLEKPSPDHVSLVGPRYIGKTVLLNALAEYFRGKRGHFDACAYWNVGHDLPNDDDGFYRAFAAHLSQAVKDVKPEYVEYLAGADVGFGTITDVFDILAEEGLKVLFIMDSVDNLLFAGNLSKNLWDGLRGLAVKSSLVFVLGSQKRLRDIVGSPEARTSPFWNLFADSTFPLGALDDSDDWKQMLAPFDERSIELQGGARTEMFNNSGGIPVLASALCKQAWDEYGDGAIVRDADIKSLAKNFVDERRHVLDDLWNDCGEEERGVATEMAARDLTTDEVPRDCLLSLRQRGFVQVSGRKVELCRPIKTYINVYKPQTTDLRRLFGNKEDFVKNIRGALELRAGQLESVDEHLVSHVRFAILKLNSPYDLVGEIRILVNRVFTIIWDSELQDRQIPTDWTAGWKLPDRDGNDPIYRPPEGRVPGSGGGQCKLLDLMTDPRKAGETSVSRQSFLMLDYLQSVGDFGQHLEDNTVSAGFAYSVCLTAIELCDQLTTDLSARPVTDGSK